LTLAKLHDMSIYYQLANYTAAEFINCTVQFADHPMWSILKNEALLLFFYSSKMILKSACNLSLCKSCIAVCKLHRLTNRTQCKQQLSSWMQLLARIDCCDIMVWITGSGKAMAGWRWPPASHVHHWGGCWEEDQHGPSVYCWSAHHQRSCGNSLGNSQSHHVSSVATDNWSHSMPVRLSIKMSLIFVKEMYFYKQLFIDSDIKRSFLISTCMLQATRWGRLIRWNDFQKHTAVEITSSCMLQAN